MNSHKKRTLLFILIIPFVSSVFIKSAYTDSVPAKSSFSFGDKNSGQAVEVYCVTLEPSFPAQLSFFPQNPGRALGLGPQAAILENTTKPSFIPVETKDTKKPKPNVESPEQLKDPEVPEIQNAITEMKALKPKINNDSNQIQTSIRLSSSLERLPVENLKQTPPPPSSIR